MNKHKLTTFMYICNSTNYLIIPFICHCSLLYRRTLGTATISSFLLYILNGHTSSSIKHYSTLITTLIFSVSHGHSVCNITKKKSMVKILCCAFFVHSSIIPRFYLDACCCLLLGKQSDLLLDD